MLMIKMTRKFIVFIVSRGSAAATLFGRLQMAFFKSISGWGRAFSQEHRVSDIISSSYLTNCFDRSRWQMSIVASSFRDFVAKRWPNALCHFPCGSQSEFQIRLEATAISSVSFPKSHKLNLLMRPRDITELALATETTTFNKTEEKNVSNWNPKTILSFLFRMTW